MSTREPLESDIGLDRDALVERSKRRARELFAREPELRSTVRSPDATSALDACVTSVELLEKAFELYAAREFLGERVATSDGDTWRFHTFGAIGGRVAAFASGLAHEKLAGPGTFVGICGFGSIDWVVADFACVRLAAVSVPLQSSMSAAELREVIGNAGIELVVVSVEQADVIMELLPLCPSIRGVVVMDISPSYARDTWPANGAQLRRIDEIETIGRKRGILAAVSPDIRGDVDPLMSLVYTSGSTGSPKGAMVPESLLRRWWRRDAWVPVSERIDDCPNVVAGYMPLSHMAGRWQVLSTFAAGGRLAFVSKSDMSSLFDDIRAIRPTTLFLVPRVAEMLYHRYRAEVARRSNAASEEEHARVADEVMTEMRTSVLGDRILSIMIGSAPTPEVVVRFLERCFDVPVSDAYGSTEAGGITTDGRVQKDVEYRLVDVPELGYRSTDEPYPRGELHVRTRFLVPGYYKNEDATRALFDDDGFMNTGDIVEQRAPDCLVWVDRAKNVVKLAQGEFVAISRLEGLFASGSAYIRQIFIYGNAARSYLLAIVVPDLDAIQKTLGGTADEGEVKAVLRSELLRVAREADLRPYEIPRDLVVEVQPFTVENGLLTASNKPARAKLRGRYGPTLEALYARLDEAQHAELAGLRAHGEGLATMTTIEKVQKAISATIGLPEGDIAVDQSFIQLGGDSLAAVGLEDVLADLTGVRVPVGLLLDSTKTVRSLAERIDRAESRHEPVSLFERVHGRGGRTLRAADLTVDRFLDGSELYAARRYRGRLPSKAQVAFLTGANGFLGRFLALELLERLEGEGSRLFALVRAPDDRAAYERLARTYQTDPRLAARFAKATANGRLVTLAGDLMEPRFGLSDMAYERLVREVDLIVHNGAIVNHALGYEQLFDANVVGTAHALRLALAGATKRLAYVSTIGILRGLPSARPFEEDADIRFAMPERLAEHGYAAGYGATKWASEVLLRHAHEDLGVDVVVFRPSEIMAHERYALQISLPDFFTRLVAGLVYTGIAPKSFYAETAPDQARHYDGLPVNAVASMIAATSAQRPRIDDPAFETFHVNNWNYDDGISLDVIVAWIRSGEYRIERMSDYAAWFSAFRDRLSRLSEAKRQHSPLVILDAWAKPDEGERALGERPLLLERLRDIDATLASLPHVSEALIHKYLDDLVGLSVIDPPATPTSVAG